MPLYGIERTVIAVIGEERDLNIGHLEALQGVEKVMRVVHPYKLVSKETKHDPSIIEVNGVKIGSNQIAVIAGPCSIESEEQMDEVARELAKIGVKIMRGGAYKPRTGPYSFQGLGKKGLNILRNADRWTCNYNGSFGYQDLDSICEKGHGASRRSNMQNFELSKSLGK